MEKKNNPNFLRQLSGSHSGDQIWIDPYTNERIWVFNPMHIVNLTKQTKSKFVRVVEGFKNFSNKWFSHVLLILFLILYGFLGAYIFQTLEGPIEAAAKVNILFVFNILLVNQPPETGCVSECLFCLFLLNNFNL